MTLSADFLNSILSSYKTDAPELPKFQPNGSQQIFKDVQQFLSWRVTPAAVEQPTVIEQSKPIQQQPAEIGKSTLGSIVTATTGVTGKAVSAEKTFTYKFATDTPPELLGNDVQLALIKRTFFSQKAPDDDIKKRVSEQERYGYPKQTKEVEAELNAQKIEEESVKKKAHEENDAQWVKWQKYCHNKCLFPEDPEKTAQLYQHAARQRLQVYADYGDDSSRREWDAKSFVFLDLVHNEAKLLWQYPPPPQLFTLRYVAEVFPFALGAVPPNFTSLAGSLEKLQKLKGIQSQVAAKYLTSFLYSILNKTDGFEFQSFLMQVFDSLIVARRSFKGNEAQIQEVCLGIKAVLESLKWCDHIKHLSKKVYTGAVQLATEIKLDAADELMVWLKEQSK